MDALATSPWQRVLTGALGRWQGGEPTDEHEGPEARGIDRLAREGNSRPAEILAVTRRRLGRFPYDSLHPGWVAEHLPDDPLLAHWVLASLPPPVREAVRDLRRAPRPPAAVFADPFGPPPWLAAWWEGRLAAAIAYPRALPWSLDRSRPSTWLWRLGAEDLGRVLVELGLRPLAAALVGLDPREVVTWAYRFPERQRNRLVALVRERDFPEQEAWREELPTEPEAPAEEVLLGLGRRSLAAHARSTAQEADVRRVAFRLPPQQGRALLAELGRDLDPLTPSSPEIWEQQTWEAAERLASDGIITAPDLSEDAA